MSKILLFGSTGQIGRELARVLLPLGDLHIVDRKQCDLARPRTLLNVMNLVRPTIVINAAAYTAVDKAETEQALAMRVNAEAPGIMAEEARRQGALFVHYSSDYVFDGRKDGSYVEHDPVNPLSVYGRSKLDGERAVHQAGGDYLILRTSWVYAAHGKNFLRTMLRLAAEGTQLRVVADQFGAPTSARLVAESTAMILRQDIARRRLNCFEGGLFHLTASGATSWHGFASAIVAAACGHPAPGAASAALPCRDVLPITTADFPLPAPRPTNSRLNCARLAQRYGLRRQHWHVGMQLCLAELLGGSARASTARAGTLDPAWIAARG